MSKPTQQPQQEKDWSSFTHFVGFDWGKKEHVVVIVDRLGAVTCRLKFEDTAAGWARLRDAMSAFPIPAVAIETSRGPAVERLLEAGITVFQVSPTASKSYRTRKAPSGVKDDVLDAWSLADALRTDGHGWRGLKPEDPLVQELRLLCRDENGLIERRTALVNTLQEALHEYFPAMLEAFDDWIMPAAWAFVERFPTPKELVDAGRRKQEKMLHALKLYRTATYERRLEIFARADQFVGAPGVTSAKRMLVLTTCRELRTLQTQMDEYRKRIEEIYAQHPDRDIFDSLPGTGPKLGPRLLSSCGEDRARFDSPEAMQCIAGTAPVSIHSGQMRIVKHRTACDKLFKHTVHLWANLSRAKCAWAQAYYQKKREQGKSHACALRCLGQRWIKILWRMWQNRETYDEAKHLKNQVTHGSWVIALIDPPEAIPARN